VLHPGEIAGFPFSAVVTAIAFHAVTAFCPAAIPTVPSTSAIADSGRSGNRFAPAANTVLILRLMFVI
jgi:hypothetical protein